MKSTAHSIKLFNTASRSIENFEAISSPSVRLYACGFTVYDYTHLGHLRKYSMDDVLVRTLRQFGYTVQHVQNVTDVGHLASDADTGEDKLEKGARKYGESAWEVAKRFEAYFFRSMDLIGNARPDVSCRATDHIESQIQMVRELEKRGHTYEIEGDGIYFDIATFPDYGKMARLQLDAQAAGERVSVEGKRHPQDFALWKFERPGENRAMVWSSPWSERGFPGWHIECSAMAIEYLGEQLDIHTGGIDHIPVHHINEIAQAESATGKSPFVRYWVHHNFLRIEGEKMSKSLGNFYTIDDVLEKKYDPRALRLLFMSAHYRSELNFTWKNLAGAQVAYDKLLTRVKSLQQKEWGGDLLETELSQPALQLLDTFRECLSDDINTPQAMAVLWETTKSKLNPREELFLLQKFEQFLALGLFSLKDSDQRKSEELVVDMSTIPVEVQELLAARAAARAANNYPEADKLRSEIETLGYTLKDTQTTQELLRVQPEKMPE